MKTVLTLVMAGDGGVYAITLMKALPSQSLSTHSCCSGGNPRSPGSDDDDALGVVLPREGIVFGAAAGWWPVVVEWCSSTMSAMANCGSVAQRGFGGAHGVVGLAQGGGAVWRHGGVDGRPGESPLFDLHSRGGLAEDGGGDYGACAQGAIFGVGRGAGDG